MVPKAFLRLHVLQYLLHCSNRETGCFSVNQDVPAFTEVYQSYRPSGSRLKYRGAVEKRRIQRMFGVRIMVNSQAIDNPLCVSSVWSSEYVLPALYSILVDCLDHHVGVAAH